MQLVGGNISLQCTASGIPVPSISWSKDGQPLQVSGDSRLSITNTVTLDTPNEKIIVSVLNFLDLLLSDSADYHCEANNTGANRAVFQVMSQRARLSVQCECCL